jgi:tetratricopeptide (TPR) repeat protein
VLANIPYHGLYPDQKICYHLTRFAVHNRLELSNTYQDEFVALKEVLKGWRIKTARVLDVCAQAIVWKIKGNIIDDSLNQWFLAAGEQAARKIAFSTEHDDLISLSSYYRALAMVPAMANDAVTTRSYMLLAENFAEAALCSERKASIIGREARKTVYESKLKELLYVARDIDGARRVAEELLVYDANWSISYHEAAEIETITHEWERALALYEAAYNIGLPRITYSQYMIGACHQQLMNFELAVEAFKATLLLDSSNISAGLAGREIAIHHLPEVLPFFNSYIDKWKSEGALTKSI